MKKKTSKKAVVSKKITPTTLHRMKVVDRKRQIMLQKFDNEIDDFLQRVPKNPKVPVKETRSLWQKIVYIIKQFRP